MTDQARSEEVARGQRAKVILEDDLYQEAFEGIRAALMQAWANTKPSQTKEREYLWMQIKAADDLRGSLTEAINTGKLAVKQLEQEKSGLLDRFIS